MMVKKRFLIVFLSASLAVVGGIVIFDSTFQKVFPSVGGDLLKGAVKGFAEDIGLDVVAEKVEEKTIGVLRRAKKAYKVTKGLAKAFIIMIAQFNQKLPEFGFYDQFLTVQAPLDIGEEPGAEEESFEEEGAEESEEFETAGGGVVERQIGLDFDLGFVGAGDIDKPFKPVEALFIYTSKVELDKKEMPIYAAQFLKSISRLIKRWEKVLKKLVVVPADLVLKGIRTIVDGFAFLLRMRPESVFRFKTLVLFNAAQQGRDNITWDQVPVHMVTLLARLADSVNETRSRKFPENRLVKDKPRKWKKTVTFKKTGIKDAVRMKLLNKIFPLQDIIFKALKVEIPRWMTDELKYRKNQKKPTELRCEYGNMRLQKGFLSKAVYLNEIIPLLDKTKLDRVDQELFVKALRVLASRRYQGLMTILGINILAPAPGAGTVIEKDLADIEMNKLAQTKGIMQERWPALIDALDKALKKARQKKFVGVLTKKLASLLAKVKAEKKEFDSILKEVTWNAKLPEGKTFDDIGIEEDPLSFLPADKQPKKSYNDPFLESLKGQEREGAIEEAPSEEEAAEAFLGEELPPIEEESGEESGEEVEED